MGDQMSDKIVGKYINVLTHCPSCEGPLAYVRTPGGLKQIKDVSIKIGGRGTSIEAMAAEVINDAWIKCPSCGHEFNPEARRE